MSMLTQAVTGLFKPSKLMGFLGMGASTPPAPPAPPVTPTVGNSQSALDAADRAATAPRTSTVLAAPGTGDDDAKKTSKVLLGS